MKYFLVFVLLCLGLAQDVRPMATDPASEIVPTTKPPTPESNSNISDSQPLSGLRRENDVFKVSKTAFNFMATVRESPSEMYLCSAIFIKKDVLLTTARCLFGRNVEKLFVHSNSSHLETEGPGNFPVKNVHLHPDFEMSPVTMDFGIITLKNPLNYITPVLLANKNIGKPRSVGTSYTWRFTPASDKFLVHEHRSQIISNSKCFLIGQEFVPNDMACADGVPSQEGHFDHGMPFIINKNRKNYLFGLNHISSTMEIKRVEKIWKVDGIVPWVNDVLKTDITKTKPSAPKPGAGAGAGAAATAHEPSNVSKIVIVGREEDEEEEEEEDYIVYNRLSDETE